MSAIETLKLNNISKDYGDVAALQNISFTAYEGDFILLLGPNGAGKTTLIKLISTLALPGTGEIWIDGLKRPEADATIRQRIGVISHHPYLYLNLTVEENLRFFASLYGLPEISTRMDTLCRQLDLLKKRNTRAKFLSRGFLQRLAIARALMHEPTLLLLDEPFTGLDTRAISRFVELLQGMKFKSVLLTTHRFDFDKKLGNRALILNQGQLICDTRQEGLENADWEKIYLDRTSQSQTAARGA